MKKTVAYYRSSTDLQEHSIEMQRSKAMYTSLEKRIIIDEEFVDEKVSARKHNWKNVPHYNNLLHKSSKGLLRILLYINETVLHAIWESIYNCMSYLSNIIFMSFYIRE